MYIYIYRERERYTSTDICLIHLAFEANTGLID